jgi:hypothetical protein
VSKTLVFHSWVAILKMMDLPMDKWLRDMAAEFERHMRDVVEPRVVVWLQTYITVATALNHVRDLFSRAARARFGARLRA